MAGHVWNGEVSPPVEQGTSVPSILTVSSAALSSATLSSRSARGGSASTVGVMMRSGSSSTCSTRS